MMMILPRMTIPTYFYQLYKNLQIKSVSKNNKHLAFLFKIQMKLRIENRMMKILISMRKLRNLHLRVHPTKLRGKLNTKALRQVKHQMYSKRRNHQTVILYHGKKNQAMTYLLLLILNNRQKPCPNLIPRISFTNF